MLPGVPLGVAAGFCGLRRMQEAVVVIWLRYEDRPMPIESSRRASAWKCAGGGGARAPRGGGARA